MTAPNLAANRFITLVTHFVKRLFASEEEQGSGSSMGFGVGAVLALVAAPGAFGSILLMAKYSTLLEWMRGERIDAIRRSPPDEYFFIVLSMTITGLVLVARWNRLFPDRRDFSNLAVLPIPIRQIFFANFAALIGLALVFAIMVNCISAVLFPFFVTISIGTVGAFLRVAAAHAFSVFSASLFSFFGVFALVGVLTLVLPRALFRPVSIAARILLVVGLLSEFFSNVGVRLFAGPSGGATYITWLPSFWFLGLYERMLGMAKPSMQVAGQRAMFSLVAAVLVATLAYAVCYRRVFLRLPESFDIFSSPRSFLRIRFPEALLRPLFRSPFERACLVFSAKVMLRSEQHLMFFGAYLGIGLVLVAETWLSAAAPLRDGSIPSADLISLPLLTAFFVASGLRVVFDIPASREANWVFQMASDNAVPQPRRSARRTILWATVSWELLLLVPMAVLGWGWQTALLQAAATVALTVFFADVLLLRFRKIPFTCVWEVDIQRLLLRMLAALFGVTVFVPLIAAGERSLLVSPGRFGLLAIVLAAGWYFIVRQNREAAGEPLIFGDGPGPVFELIKLT